MHCSLTSRWPSRAPGPRTVQGPGRPLTQQQELAQSCVMPALYQKDPGKPREKEIQVSVTPNGF